MMNIQFGREICGNLNSAESREWLVTNGIGGYASGTISGLLTRRYHGLLVAALKPPLNRTLLVTKLDETVFYHHQSYALDSNRWTDGGINLHGYENIESFRLEGTIPVWTFACADALVEKRIWMQPGANTTYIRYTLLRGSGSLDLSLKALVNYRDYHGNTSGRDWQMQIQSTEAGVRVSAFKEAIPFYILCIGNKNHSKVSIYHDWYLGFDLALEKYRGLNHSDDNLHAATFTTNLKMGESITIVASTQSNPSLEENKVLEASQEKEKQLLNNWYSHSNVNTENTPKWIEQLVLAADQFIVNRPLINQPDGKTIIAGYPWFGDWGRDTMISLPGLTITTGRPLVARTILGTFSRYLDKGMLPNLFPDAGEQPEYNTVDAILWYFEAIRAYYAATKDDKFLAELFPLLAEVIEWHCRGTRYNIHLDDDGLIYAGESGVQLTWMDAKIGDWVVTPRIGKPVEINALWYNALVVMAQFANILGKSSQVQEYQRMLQQTATSFQRFWNRNESYCYDVLDTPGGDDDALRPNQIFAVSLPALETGNFPPLLNSSQQRSVVDKVAQNLLTSYGLRSLAPQNSEYKGKYGGNQLARDSAYHQGTTWGWLIGHFVQAHLKVYQNPTVARSFLKPMANHLQTACVGNISEIFDGDVPINARGCFAQAWSVAEVLRAWQLSVIS